MRKILYIDGFNVILAINSVTHITDGNSQPIGAYLGTINMIKVFIEKFKPSKVIFALDGPDAGERRRQLFPEYKNKRRVTGRESKVTIMEGDDNIVYGSEGAFQNQLIQIFNFLKLLPVTVCIVPYCEADDIISYLSLKNKNDFENIIISNDKDYLQLVQKGISVYRWKTKILYNEELMKEEFKILAGNFIYMKILLGDVSDAIKGLKGIGKKTFKCFHSFLYENDFSNDVNKFINCLENMDLTNCNTRERNAIKKIISEENFEKILLSYKLMKLDENCISEEMVSILSLQINEQKNKKVSSLSARRIMMNGNFNKLYNGFNDERWLHPFAFIPPGVDVNI